MKNKLEFVLVLQTKLLLASVLSSRMASLQIWHPQERFWLCVCDSLFKDKVFLFARSNVRVILQHASHVFVMSLKPPLFLWSRLFPSLNRGLKENIKLVRTNRNLKGQNGQDIKNKPRSKDAGLDVCPAFIHSARPSLQPGPAPSITMKTSTGNKRPAQKLTMDRDLWTQCVPEGWL